MNLRHSLNLSVILIIILAPLQSSAFITLSSLTSLKDLTVLSRSRILGLVPPSLLSPLASLQVLGSQGEQVQQVIASRPEERDVDSGISEILTELNEAFKTELNRPLEKQDARADTESRDSSPTTQQQCPEIITQHHEFMNATVWLMRDLFQLVGTTGMPGVGDGGEREEERGSGQGRGFYKEVEKSVAEMQRIWASRKSNVQDRSFIEQLLACYQDQPCFKKNEVLRRCVEVVEYLNDLLDTFP